MASQRDLQRAEKRATRHAYMNGIFGGAAPEAALETRIPSITTAQRYKPFTTEFDLREDFLKGTLPRMGRELVTAETAESIIPGDPRHSSEHRAMMPVSTAAHIEMDLSGSNRGRPIVVQAQLAFAVTRLLQAAGVDVSLSGHTTSRWKGGQSREKWLREGREANPGRLNDLLTVDFQAPSNRMRPHLKRMLATVAVNEGLLKENIDGEALVRAHTAMLQSPADCRSIIMLGDMASVDDSTLSVNPKDILAAHAQSVVRAIDEYSPVRLIGVPMEMYGEDRNIRFATTVPFLQDAGNDWTMEHIAQTANDIFNAVYEHACIMSVDAEVAGEAQQEATQEGVRDQRAAPAPAA